MHCGPSNQTFGWMVHSAFGYSAPWLNLYTYTTEYNSLPANKTEGQKKAGAADLQAESIDSSLSTATSWFSEWKRRTRPCVRCLVPHDSKSPANVRGHLSLYLNTKPIQTRPASSVTLFCSNNIQSFVSPVQYNNRVRHLTLPAQYQLDVYTEHKRCHLASNISA